MEAHANFDGTVDIDLDYVCDEVESRLSIEDKVADAIDYDQITENVSDNLDTYAIAQDVERNLDYSEMANEVQGYLDTSSIAEDVMHHLDIDEIAAQVADATAFSDLVDTVTQAVLGKVFDAIGQALHPGCDFIVREREPQATVEPCGECERTDDCECEPGVNPSLGH